MSNDKNNSGNKAPWTARRIIALVGILLLLALYGSTMIFALSGSPDAKGWLMASIFGTIAIPVLLYAMTTMAKNLRGRGYGAPSEEDDDLEDDNKEK